MSIDKSTSQCRDQLKELASSENTKSAAKINDAMILEAFNKLHYDGNYKEPAVFTTTEIVMIIQEDVDIQRSTVYKRLQRLEEEGILRSRIIDNSRCWQIGNTRTVPYSKSILRN